MRTSLARANSKCTTTDLGRTGLADPFWGWVARRIGRGWFPRRRGTNGEAVELADQLGDERFVSAQLL